VSFEGFPQETLEFLAQLRSHNDRAWFEAHRQDYERWYVEPARQFVVAAGERLHRFAGQVEAQPRILGSIFRINRDIRFSKDKRPYKDHLDFWFWNGDRKRAVSGFFVRIGPEIVGIGAGSHGFDSQARAAFKAVMEEHGPRSQLERIASTLDFAGYRLSSTPTLQARDLYVHVDEPPVLVTQPELLERCAEHWHQLLPLHRWLVDHVQQALVTSV
jgi:uncharacterized protein (TIGR02453 family)